MVIPMSQEIEFANLSEYRRYITQSLGYSYSQYGHIFAPNPHRDEATAQNRSLLDEYMRRLHQMALGAVLLLVEVWGNRAIDLAMSSGEVYEISGIWATRVQTETFAYYTTDPEAEGQEEWLPFLLDETYVGRDGKARQKMNQKALNLAYKKPLEGEVVTEVHERFSRWLEPVLDMFRRHWEVRSTIEGKMVLFLYFEYSSNVQNVLRKWTGENRQQQRAEAIEALMNQLLLDVEEVRQTAPQRQYTDSEIIDAVRRAIHNFCVDMNRRLVELLGSKRFVKMFLEGGTEPALIYHTNRNPNDWRSPMLGELDLVKVAERAFLMLAENDLNRSKARMDQKATDTYAPVSHAETRAARQKLGELEEAHSFEDDREQEDLPFGLSFAPEDAELTDIETPTLIDILAHREGMQVVYAPADLSGLPYVTIKQAGDKAEVIHRSGGLAEAATSLRAALSKLDEASAEAARSQIRLLHDPDARLGAEGSTRLLRILDAEFKAEIQQQGDRYWAEWAVVQIGTVEEEEAVQVTQRLVSAAEAGVLLKRKLDEAKAILSAAAFKSLAARLKLVCDPEGHLGATGTTRARKELTEAIEAQLKPLHYAVRRGQVIIRVHHLGEAVAQAVDEAVAAEMLNRATTAAAVE